MSNIISKLEAKRTDLGMSYRAFAAALGVSVVHYLDTIKGRERFGQALARGVARRFPELASEAALAIVDAELQEAAQDATLEEDAHKGVA
jgi:transposase